MPTDPRILPLDPASPINICDTCGRQYVPTLANDAKHPGCPGTPGSPSSRRELQRFAKEARFNGPWSWYSVRELHEEAGFPLPTARLFAACTPDVILALCAALEAGEADTRRLDWMERHANPAHAAAGSLCATVRDMHTSDRYEGDSLRDCVDEALAMAARSPHPEPTDDAR